MFDINEIKQWTDYDNHALVLPLEDTTLGWKGFVAIHREQSGVPSLGATRLWNYSTEKEAIRDVLRLSRLMSYKSALAGLPYGGAKAVILASPVILQDREALFRSYARIINELQGRFVTGTDVGVNNEDLENMRKETAFVIGCGVNSAYFTAIGILESIKVCLQRMNSSAFIAGKRFAIQGLGKTGFALAKLLVNESAGVVIAADVDKQKIIETHKLLPTVVFVDPDNLYNQEVDVFSPCALGGVLNDSVVSRLRCRAIVGSANNQLATLGMDEKIFQRGILYAPDYLVNAGGLISVVDQYKNSSHSNERIRKSLERIPQILGRVLDLSLNLGKPTSMVADGLAKSMREPVGNVSYVATNF